jgi:hypothetical protein
MSFVRAIIAGAAGVAAYRIVEHFVGVDESEPSRLEKVERDAVVVVGSRLDRVPNAHERDVIVEAVNAGGQVLANAAGSELRHRMVDGGTSWPVKLSAVVLTYGLVEELMKPMMGFGEASSDWSSGVRRMLPYVVSRWTGSAVRDWLADGN